LPICKDVTFRDEIAANHRQRCQPAERGHGRLEQQKIKCGEVHSSFQRNPSSAAALIIGTGVTLNFQAAINAPTKNTRIRATARPWGLIKSHTVENITPATAAAVPAIAAITNGFFLHASYPTVNNRASTADGSVTASTAAIAPGIFRIFAPTAAQ